MNYMEINIELIIEEYKDYVYTIIKNTSGNALIPADIDEIISDVFFLIWKNSAKIKTNLKAYIATTARNCAINRMRENKIAITEYDDKYLYSKEISD